MKVEVLQIAGCRGAAQTMVRLRAALDATGRGDIDIADVVIRTPEDASRVPFAGSPTIVVDGADLFPEGARSAALACRVYATPAGVADAPTQDQIEERLEARGAPSP